jgi:hypothetical protein
VTADKPLFPQSAIGPVPCSSSGVREVCLSFERKRKTSIARNGQIIGGADELAYPDLSRLLLEEYVELLSATVVPPSNPVWRPERSTSSAERQRATPPESPASVAVLLW